jgi:hypothetical protein
MSVESMSMSVPVSVFSTVKFTQEHEDKHGHGYAAVITGVSASHLESAGDRVPQ